MTGRGPCSAMRLSICERNYASPTYLASLKDCVAGDQQFHLVLFGKDIKERVSNNSDRIEAIKHDLVVDLARAVAIQFE